MEDCTGADRKGAAVREPDTARVARTYDAMAGDYDRMIGRFERYALGDARSWAVGQARGRVVEIAVGTGLNLPLYGAEVEHVVGVDISREMLDRARARRAEGVSAVVDLRLGDAQALDIPDECTDTVISTYAMCTIPDPGRVAHEAFRVLVPGGRFVLAEHGPSTNAVVRAIMRLIEPLFVRFGADHLTREPVGYLERAGFLVDDVQRSGRGRIVFRVLARKPGPEWTARGH